MTANQFYIPSIDPEASRIVLEGGEHRHLAKAARVRAGENIWLFDASGRRCLARVERVGKDRTEAAVLKMEEPEALRTKVVLAPCLVEAKKLESIIEKAAELGCTDVVPIVSARSLRASDERSGRKLDRWSRIAREATKQCKGRLVTVVHRPRRLKELLGEPVQGLRLFLSEHGGRPLREFVAGRGAPGGGPPATVLLLVGPKGGWTEGEETEIRRAGFAAVSLGRRVLRAETAAIAGAFLIVHFWNG